MLNSTLCCPQSLIAPLKENFDPYGVMIFAGSRIIHNIISSLSKVKPMITLSKAASIIQRFERSSLTERISGIESTLKEHDKNTCGLTLPTLAVDFSLLNAALVFKRAASQVHVLIHAAGILLSLPHILRDGEVIETLSLGAGNTGRSFDLETNFRVAEFKFIDWKGGSESIRQNSLFKDFYLLAEHESHKERYLYVTGTQHPLNFFNSGRAIKSVMSRNNKVWSEFQAQYGSWFTKVCEYYEYRKDRIKLIDITTVVPGLADILTSESTEVK